MIYFNPKTLTKMKKLSKLLSVIVFALTSLSTYAQKVDDFVGT